MAAPVGEAEVEASADEARETFAAFVAEHEPPLRRSLVAAFGPEVGRDAADVEGDGDA